MNSGDELPGKAPELASRSRLSALDLNWQAAALYASVGILWLLLTFASPYFFTFQNISNILLQSSVAGIMAIGFTILLIGGEIDLSIGSVQALAGTFAAVLLIQLGIPVWLGIGAVALLGVAVGLVNAYFTLVARVPSFIVTLAMLGIAQGLAFVIASGRTIGGFPTSFEVLGRGRLGAIPIPVMLLLVVTGVAHLVLHQTRWGVELFAVGGNRRAAELVGLRVKRVLTLAFVASASLSALAGLVLSSRLNAGHGSFGSEILLEAVAAVVIGGTSLSGGAGSPFGTLAGVLLINTIKNGLILLGVEPFWQQVVVGLLILVAVLMDHTLKGNLRFSDLLPGMNRPVSR